MAVSGVRYSHTAPAIRVKSGHNQPNATDGFTALRYRHRHAWNNAGTTDYNMATARPVFFTINCDVQWAPQNSQRGISYTNVTNSVYYRVAGITVQDLTTAMQCPGKPITLTAAICRRNRRQQSYRYRNTRKFIVYPDAQYSGGHDGLECNHYADSSFTGFTYSINRTGTFDVAPAHQHRRRRQLRIDSSGM